MLQYVIPPTFLLWLPKDPQFLIRSTGVEHGIGKHIFTLLPYHVQQALKAFWVSQIFYKLTINSTKISILYLYLRIFPRQILWFRYVTYVAITYITLYALATVITTIFQCTPVPKAWDHSIEGTCIDLTKFWYANAINNIAGDILTLALPWPLIRKLQLPKGAKVGLFSVLGLGI
ncbi:MAG: hypothetical protein Q9181_002824, partial [Wetmoreana brouardii]